MLQRDEDQRRTLIGGILKSLPGGSRKSALKDFADCLFGDAAYEDLAAYAPEDLAQLAQSAWTLSGTR